MDANGDPYSGAYLFFYAAGSSTKQDTFTSSSGGVACPNPITLNASGYPAISGTVTVPWGTVGQTYKIGLAAPGSSDPPNSFIWSADNIAPVNDTTVSVDQWVSGPAPTYVSATQFTLVGDQTSTFQVGRRVKTTNSGGTIYSRITASAYTVLTTVTVVNDSGTLDSGLSAVSYGLLSATNPSIPILVNPIVSGTLTGSSTMLSPITASLGADVALNNTGLFFDGPSVAQGSTGTWFASGQIVVTDTAGAATCIAKLWDGTTIIASQVLVSSGAGVRIVFSLAGFITSPAGNLRISVQDASSTSGGIRFNSSGSSKDSTITAIRIG